MIEKLGEPMIGAALTLFLAILFCARLRMLPPAARVAAGYLLGIGTPVLSLCLLARLGIPAGRVAALTVFLVIGALVITVRRRKPQGPPTAEDRGWIGMLALTLSGAAITALVGRSSAQELLIDPWAHIAWSRNLPAALEFYPPGFPALTAILGFDHRLVGAFRLAPVILQGALIAQFLAVGERVRAVWPAAVLALGYLTVPVAFGKFDPPRPELWAAVLIAASWWTLITNVLAPRSKYLALGGLTCLLAASHLSYLEISHFASLAFAILLGNPIAPSEKRPLLFASVVAGAILSLAISPWPLYYLSHLGSAPLTTSQEAAVGLLDPLAMARMLGWMLGVAAVAGVVWIVLNFKRAYQSVGGVVPGVLVFGILNLTPALLIAAGVYIPISFTPYRYVLAAVLPLALLITIITGLVRERTRWGYHAFVLLTALFAFDIATRPTFSWVPGAAALALAIAGAWAALGSRRKATAAAAGVVALAVAVGVRLWTWFPAPPPDARWLVDHGDPTLAVVSNWPLTNALDALVPQRVYDGLAGDDGNVAHHRAWEIPPLREDLRWCDARAEAAVDALRASLERMGALPAYLVVGERFQEAWRTYRMQYETIARSGRLGRYDYYAAEPCGDEAPGRLAVIHGALEKSPVVRREFASDGVVIYRIH